jgi:cytochrome c oxidase assembly protein subunit 11
MSDKSQNSGSTNRNPVSAQQIMKLFLIPVLMFGFGFALVPLYDVFCEVTGLNGKTGRVEASIVNQKEVDESRLITVRFLANSGTGLQWSFEPVVKEMEVHPGQIYQAMYRVSSKTDKDTVGQAIPSVSPPQASLHFNKTECFCFSEQKLAGRETRDMPLRFIINHDLPKEIVEMTLSYTFFNIEENKG